MGAEQSRTCFSVEVGGAGPAGPEGEAAAGERAAAATAASKERQGERPGEATGATAAKEAPEPSGGLDSVFGSRARAHRPSALLDGTLERPDRRRPPASVSGTLRTLPDGARGAFGPGACALLEQPFDHEAGPGTRYVRVGTHKDGSCFFHAVLCALNLDTRVAMAPGSNRLNDAGFGRPNKRTFAYRNLSSADRAAAGVKWRAHLARRVSEHYFNSNLNTAGASTPRDGAGVFCAARGRQISFAEYQADFADPKTFVGDTVWGFVAKQVGVNIFILVASHHKLAPDADGEELPRVYVAGKYNDEQKSVFLLLIDRGAGGHYEALVDADGLGCFRHFDGVTQLSLDRMRFQNSPKTPK